MINNFLELKERINDEFSLSVIRFGNVEMQSILNRNTKIYEQMYTNAGFYCKDKKKAHQIFLKWKNLYVASVYNCDLMLDVVSCHSFQILGDLLNRINTWRPSLPYIEEPSWWIENVINEYKGTIGIVSYFKITGNEPDDHWLQTFNKLKKRVKNQKEPGLWLVSCGCYGVPLCEDIKNNGKKAIYVGGLLQLLFGLKGKRWDDRQELNSNYNKYWTYPTEKPTNGELVEAGCYWGDESKKN